MTDGGALLVDRIGQLVTNEPVEAGPGADGTFDPLGIRHDAALVAVDGRVAWIGPSGAAPACDTMVDARNGCVIPGFVDSHTHLVFAGDRVGEFADRMAGRRYTGGGIVRTVAATRAASDAELSANLGYLVRELVRQGTTTFECKSGYGLTVEHEARLLRLARGVTDDTTFLGAHLVPAEYADRPDEYVDLVRGPMLAAAAPYARWIDVFCDSGAFDVDAARAVLTAGAASGLGLRMHGNQLGPGPGVQLAVELGAASVDHCTYLSGADIDALSTSDTVATLLPGVEFATRSPYPDARALLGSGVRVALATDCNPGSCFSSSMPLCVALAVREMRMTPAEALWSATAGGAAALRRTDVGVLATGSRADLVVLDAPSYVYLAYRPGVPLVRTVVRGGRIEWQWET